METLKILRLRMIAIYDRPFKLSPNCTSTLDLEKNFLFNINLICIAQANLVVSILILIYYSNVHFLLQDKIFLILLL